MNKKVWIIVLSVIAALGIIAGAIFGIIYLVKRSNDNSIIKNASDLSELLSDEGLGFIFDAYGKTPFEYYEDVFLKTDFELDIEADEHDVPRRVYLCDGKLLVTELEGTEYKARNLYSLSEDESYYFSLDTTQSGTMYMNLEEGAFPYSYYHPARFIDSKNTFDFISELLSLINTADFESIDKESFEKDKNVYTLDIRTENKLATDIMKLISSYVISEHIGTSYDFSSFTVKEVLAKSTLTLTFSVTDSRICDVRFYVHMPKEAATVFLSSMSGMDYVFDITFCIENGLSYDLLFKTQKGDMVYDEVSLEFVSGESVRDAIGFSLDLSRSTRGEVETEKSTLSSEFSPSLNSFSLSAENGASTMALSAKSDGEGKTEFACKRGADKINGTLYIGNFSDDVSYFKSYAAYIESVSELYEIGKRVVEELDMSVRDMGHSKVSYYSEKHDATLIISINMFFKADFSIFAGKYVPVSGYVDAMEGDNGLIFLKKEGEGYSVAATLASLTPESHYGEHLYHYTNEFGYISYIVLKDGEGYILAAYGNDNIPNIGDTVVSYDSAGKPVFEVYLGR